jgi:aminoglycoside 9-adenylyltransferase
MALPPRAEFVYGEWLREEFESGAVPEPTRDPDLAIVLKKVIDNSLPLFGDDAVNLFNPVPMKDILRGIRESLPNLLDGVEGDERNVILTLARMWLTAATGDIAPKDISAQWAALQLPEDQASILNEARLGYLGKLDDSWHDRKDELRKLIRQMQSSVETCLDSRPKP